MPKNNITVENYTANFPSPGQPVDKLQRMLHDATHEQLCEIIRKKAERDESFRTEALMRLGAPDRKEALNTTKERIRIAIRQNTSRGFIGWSGCDAICNEISDCLDATKSMYLDRFPEIGSMLKFRTV